MRLLVLGATGGTGQQVVMQALEQGHDVTALVRDPGKMKLDADRLHVVVGSLPQNVEAVTQAVRGQDAVISTLGVGPGLKSSHLISRAMRAIVPVMEAQQVRRLIFTSACGVGETFRDVPLLPRILYRLLLGDIFADKLEGERYIQQSNTSWTIVYPVFLTNGPRTASYRAGEHLDLRGFPTISRANVADFLLKQLVNAAFVQKGVIVSA